MSDIVITGLRVEQRHDDTEQAGSEILQTISLRVTNGSNEPTIVTLDLAFHQGAMPDDLQDDDSQWTLTMTRTDV